MDQGKIGTFLKELRKEKDLTQEDLAEQLNVSNRTISRWETGSNMPDISMLVEIADFYEVSIPEIIDGERKSENMNQETRDTAIKMAEYSKNEVKVGKQKVIGYLMSVFGIFIIVSALAIFPNDSSWGSIYSIIGSIIMVIGIYLTIKPVVVKRSLRILSVIASVVLLFGVFTVSDYIAVSQFHQVPRFRYATYFDSRQPDQLIHKTLFFTVVQKNPGTEYEIVEIVK
ncbi:transcriptional regulator [Hornefia porci]|uniref:Transcriptional regulator n=1 Tax=Hornefia porci TaxID=2652292 RepID=A0A1Q9JFH8_9FIRM|nr:helix-turn-helix transcriptional regulator [Hornefia porci]OLR54986.1 transcriptional regulator [Hornefia porci]